MVKKIKKIIICIPAQPILKSLSRKDFELSGSFGNYSRWILFARFLNGSMRFRPVRFLLVRTTRPRSSGRVNPTPETHLFRFVSVRFARSTAEKKDRFSMIHVSGPKRNKKSLSATGPALALDYFGALWFIGFQVPFDAYICRRPPVASLSPRLFAFPGKLLSLFALLFSITGGHLPWKVLPASHLLCFLSCTVYWFLVLDSSVYYGCLHCYLIPFSLSLSSQVLLHRISWLVLGFVSTIGLQFCYYREA